MLRMGTFEWVVAVNGWLEIWPNRRGIFICAKSRCDACPSHYQKNFRANSIARGSVWILVMRPNWPPTW